MFEYNGQQFTLAEVEQAAADKKMSLDQYINQFGIKKIDSQIVRPTIEGLQKDGMPYKGFVFIGLIKVGGEPKVIEYNVRMGDPETEVVLPRIKNDFLTILQAIHENCLDRIELEVDSQAAATVMAVSQGYPQDYEKGKEISGLDEVSDKMIFHAGTTLKEGKVLTSGGRVMAVTSFGQNHKEAITNSYETLNKVCFEGINYRKDIGFDL